MDRPWWTAVERALKGLGLALFLVTSSAAGARGGGTGIAASAELAGEWQIERWNPYIREASVRFRIPEDWIRRVMLAESSGRTMVHGRPITSRVGAMGLMQLMPGTWTQMRARHGLGRDPHDPRDNILAGAAYLRAMYDRFGYPGLFAAYNAGPARYAGHLATGRGLPAETVAYIEKVGGQPGRSPSLRREPPRDDIFVALGERFGGPVEAAKAEAAPRSLFVRLSSVSDL